MSYSEIERNTAGVSIILGIIIFARCRPYFLWDYEDFLRPVCSIIVTMIALMNLSREKKSFLVFCLLSLSYIWASVIIDHSSIITLFNFIGLACIPIIKRGLVISTYKVFRKIIILTVSTSFLVYVITLCTNFITPSVLIHQNGPDLYTYNVYPFLVRGLDTFSGESIRFQALFDEPGMLGTILGLILISERMNILRIGNLVLLLCGIFTLSFYFYVTMIIGFLFFSSRVKHRWRWVIILGVFVMLTYNIPFFYDNLWYRFSYDSDTGSFVGNNRNGWGLKDYYDSIKWTPIFFTGLGSRFAEQFSGAASLNLIIVKHGLIFVLLNVGAYLILSYREIKNRQLWLMFMIYFILTLYQRPGFYATYSVFLYTMTIYMFGRSEKNEQILQYTYK